MTTKIPTVKDGQTYLTFKIFESTLTKRDCEVYEVVDYVMEVELRLPTTVFGVTADDGKGHVIRGDKHLNF